MFSSVFLKDANHADVHNSCGISNQSISLERFSAFIIIINMGFALFENYVKVII